ncbi:hypothetical protein BV25DRAFT_1581354 [Artomyces pyxidatus]|uniref:Uncharacterized protein n=1 Tax=Artomyces pyxidatus TaxID=48021 RepID=A0ACB8TC98_9AGAM|nr:hypothetical protein BV25DRAFT_1581354 [Artomyces pyxidatus]
MGATLLLLPSEILLVILEMLHARDILACNTTCHHLHTNIENSVSLQYALELFACGMLDGARGTHTLPVPERLRCLLLYTAGWEKLLWTGSIALPHLAGSRTVIGVSGGMLVLLQRDSFVNLHAVSRLCVQRLPSEMRTIDEHHDVHTIPDILHLSSVKLDSAQGVIVVDEGSLRHPKRTQVRLLSIARVHDICGDFLLQVDKGPSRECILRS